MNALWINEIFSSVNGEVCTAHQGSLCTFIRFQGCNLNCRYCDTRKALEMKAGMKIPISEIVKKVEELGNRNITITGGEPLLQREGLHNLLDLLVAEGYSISIETNGTRIPNITKYPYESVRYVMDYKSLSSGANKAMKNAAFLQLKSKDFLKFVVSSEEDFKDCMERLRILFGSDPDKIMPRIAFSPIVKDIKPKALMLLMQRENFLKKIGAILNLQLHKMIGVA